MLLQQGSRCLGSIRCRAPLLLPHVSVATSHGGISRPWSSSLSTTSRAAAVDGSEQTHESVSDTAAAAGLSREGPSPEASSSSDSWEESEFPEMQLVLPPPTNSQIKSAEFVKSSVEVSQCPPPKFPEFAVIGRSNVGKSSLINLLTNRKSLAMVSKQPGKDVLACVYSC